MTDDHAVREALDGYLAAEPPMNLAVDAVLAAGRRRRALRQAAGTVIGAVTIAAAAFAVYVGPTPFGVTVAGPSSESADRYFQYADPVAMLIQDRVRTTLPTVPLKLTEIYPTGWNQNVALQPSQAKNATEWQALYKIGGDDRHELWISVDIMESTPATEAQLRRTCKTPPGSECSYAIGKDGSSLLRQTRNIGDGLWARTARHERLGNRYVVVEERIRAAALADARWTIPVANLDKLATDAELKIPR